jgi:beta-glucosidase
MNHLCFAILIVLFSRSISVPISAQCDPWWNASIPFADRVEALLAEMTIAEKISQLDYNPPEIPRLGIPAFNYWSEGTHGVAFAGVATVFPSPLALAATFDVNVTNR